MKNFVFHYTRLLLLYMLAPIYYKWMGFSYLLVSVLNAWQKQTHQVDQECFWSNQFPPKWFFVFIPVNMWQKQLLSNNTYACFDKIFFRWVNFFKFRWVLINCNQHCGAMDVVFDQRSGGWQFKSHSGLNIFSEKIKFIYFKFEFKYIHIWYCLTKSGKIYPLKSDANGFCTL